MQTKPVKTEYLPSVVDTFTAARLTGEPLRTVQDKVAKGKYTAAICQDVRGGASGKAYVIPVSALPPSAQIKLCAQAADNRIGDVDLVSYRQKYGEEGVEKVLDRRKAVLECIAIENTAARGDVKRLKEELAAKYGTTLRTIYRWKEAYGERGLAGLMDKVEQSNKGKLKAMCLFAQDFAKSQLCSEVKRTNRSVYEKLQRLDAKLGCDACARCPHCEGSIVRREFALGGVADQYNLCDRPGGGMVVPSNPSAFNRFVTTIPAGEMAMARFGPKYWEAHFMPKAQREKPERVNECWFGDHHMFDLFVIDDDGCIVRPWMTAWSDAATGCFHGWCITTNPNSTTIAETFVRAIPRKPGSPFYGTPALIYIDNGKDYRSKRFEGDREVEHVIGRLNEQMSKTALLQVLGVEVIHAQPYKAWSKTIERLFGTLENRYMRELPGWCGNSPANRPEDFTRTKLERLAEQGKLMTLRQFERIMRTQVMPAYHAERFDNAASPLELYRALPMARDDIPGWDVLALIKSEAATRKVSPMGVKLHNDWYWDDALRQMIGQEVTIRYNKDDNITVTIIQGNRYVCEAALKDKLRMVHEDEEKLAAHMRLQKDVKRETRAALASAHKAVDTALRNVVYEEVDPAAVGVGNITTLEYRKAAKGKAEKRDELARRNVKLDEAAEDTVADMFKSMGREFIDRGKVVE